MVSFGVAAEAALALRRQMAGLGSVRAARVQKMKRRIETGK